MFRLMALATILILAAPVAANDADDYSNRGLKWLSKNEYDKAIADFTEALKLEPKRLTAYFNRGIAWFQKKEYDKAIADYTEVIKLDPKFIRAYINRGVARFRNNQSDKA